MTLPTQFAAQTLSTGQQLDDNFAAVGALGAIPCLIAGTNAIVLTPAVNTPTVSAYANNRLFGGIAAASNTGAVTAQVGGLAALAVFQDATGGPSPLIGGEMIAGNYVLLGYDSALAGGAGGFHLIHSVAAPFAAGRAGALGSNVGTTLSLDISTGLFLLARTGAPGAPFSDTTDTAAAMLASMVSPFPFSTFRIRIFNSTGQTQTVLAGANVTMIGPVTILAGASREFIGLVTSISPAAVSMYG
jgi:hypothetical protein